MRGHEYLNDKNEITRLKKKVAKKPNTKRSDHKHNYVVKKVVKDGVSRVEWEKIYSACDICGKEKYEIKHI